MKFCHIEQNFKLLALLAFYTYSDQSIFQMILVYSSPLSSLVQHQVVKMLMYNTRQIFTIPYISISKLQFSISKIFKIIPILGAYLNCKLWFVDLCEWVCVWLCKDHWWVAVWEKEKDKKRKGYSFLIQNGNSPTRPGRCWSNF